MANCPYKLQLHSIWCHSRHAFGARLPSCQMGCTHIVASCPAQRQPWLSLHCCCSAAPALRCNNLSCMPMWSVTWQLLQLLCCNIGADVISNLVRASKLLCSVAGALRRPLKLLQSGPHRLVQDGCSNRLTDINFATTCCIIELLHASWRHCGCRIHVYCCNMPRMAASGHLV